MVAGPTLGAALNPLGITPAAAPPPTVSADATDTLLLTMSDIEAQRIANGTLAETVNLTPTLGAFWGQVLTETVRLSEVLSASALYNLALGEALGLTDTLAAGLPAAVAETLNLTETLAGVRAVLLLETLGLTETFLPALISQRTAAEVVAFTDSLAQFFAGDITETLNLSETWAPQLQAYAANLETLNLSETWSPLWMLRVTADDTLDLSATALLQALWDGSISETIVLDGGYLAPDGSFTTWAMNTSTAAVTEYTNYVFNSFARMGNKYLGASDTGLYELLGDNDAGADIIATLKGGYFQFGGSRLSRLNAAYIAARGEGQFVLKIRTGDGQEYIYQTNTRNMRSTKVHMGKGMRARYFSFELVSTGQDFDLESLEFVPIVVQRRV